MLHRAPAHHLDCASGPGPRPRGRELWPLLQGWLPQVPERRPVCGQLSALWEEHFTHKKVSLCMIPTEAFAVMFSKRKRVLVFAGEG